MSKAEYYRLIVALQPQVLRSWLWKYTKTLRAAEAEDLIQEIRTRLLEVGEATIRDWQNEEHVRKYAFGVAGHVGIDWLRQHTRVSGVRSGADAHEHADERHNPERCAIAREELQMLWKILRRMPKKRRRVVTLLKVYRCSIEETAQQLHMKECTVKTHLRRAIKACVAQLKEKNAAEEAQLLARLLKGLGFNKDRGPMVPRKPDGPSE